MCRFVRCTMRRTALCRVMRTRVFAARRILDAFLSMSLAPLPGESSGNWFHGRPIAALPVELSGNFLSAPTIAPLFHLSRSHLLLLGFFEGHDLARIAH